MVMLVKVSWSRYSTRYTDIGQDILHSSDNSDKSVNVDPALPYEHFVEKDTCRLYGNAGQATQNEYAILNPEAEYTSLADTHHSTRIHKLQNYRKSSTQI